MLIIPQLYIRNKKSVALERTITPLYDEDPLTMAMRIKDARGEAVFIMDLGIPHVGTSENAQLISRIKDETGLAVFIGGGFRSIRSIEAYLTMGLKMVILETVAYQQPTLVSDACKHFPDGVAVHINVQAGRVTIPGWTVAANKTAFDYAEQFGELGVSTFFYSDVGGDGFMGNENYENILLFCKKVHRHVMITSEIRGSADIERLATLGAPGLDGLVLTRALYEGRIDLNGAIGLVSDLSAASSNDPTIQDE
jgi:phosphoribosylformimino-5-aminoimidazole carboxamide ribotide isomerase